ncbi:BgTH12-03671 [Blumeria graminis f. sp. triticale]|uniref:Bgt-158 n=3 Tax=Blumeria graminis TaxID=34373 RepID=A0A061HFH7_BLUGR|nr:hypothetical protein BGT96224_158 [Blumeria graminis f. sp. tritici 96224]CAD6499560.1 BgTH12-03671 [Blumeria graminis f. sp. triticale]VCU39727.1 Bgt-158 [Blumeria graminis f. sp. tritici]
MALEPQLSTAVTHNSTKNLTLEIHKSISSFPTKIISSQNFEEFDRCGTAIWNTCTRLRRDIEFNENDEGNYLLFLARIFAFFLLDCAHQCGEAPAGNLLRLIKVGIKAAKNCIDRKDCDMALRVLGKVGGYQDSLKVLGEESDKKTRHSCERAWHMEQFDIAEHMFCKATSSENILDDSTAESLGDTLYEIGRDLLNKQQYSMAVKWLRRAFGIINSHELDKLSKDASALRISIQQSLIKALLGLQDNDSLEEAQNWLDMLELEVGDKLVVLLLRLEAISVCSGDKFDSNAYSDVLQRLMAIVHLTESNFRLLMYHVRRLNDKSPNLACRALEILNTRVMREDRDEYVEKILITRLWMAVDYRDTQGQILQLETLFSELVANLKSPISSVATLAAHTLLWKKIESNYMIGHYDAAENWCKLAMHKIFEKSGDLNMARISRKLLLCALAKNEINTAKEIFASMSEVGKNEPMSRFLMYKIANRCGDSEMAVECLHKISSASIKDPTLLQACCLDAQQMGNKPQLLVTLQLIIEEYAHDSSSGIHLPSLLRFTIGLMSGMLEEAKKSGSQGNNDIIEKLCVAFESAISSVRNARISTKTEEKLWTVDEHDWYSKNSYSIAIKHFTEWDPRQTLRMIKCCIGFIDYYPPDPCGQISTNHQLRKLFCEFSAATVSIILARAEENIESQLQCYLEVRKHVKEFITIIQHKFGTLDGKTQLDLNRKFPIISAFDFEAACRLKSWDDLEQIIAKNHSFKNIQAYEIMADCILCADAPTKVIVTILGKIVSEAWKIEDLNTSKLAKYMRCLFQIAIAENTEIAEELLDQVCRYAEEASKKNQKYPSEELEWIATRAFNHAVDLYCWNDDNGCLRWSSKALNISHYCTDNGALKKTLQDKLIKLKLDV